MPENRTKIEKKKKQQYKRNEIGINLNEIEFTKRQHDIKCKHKKNRENDGWLISREK